MNTGRPRLVLVLNKMRTLLLPKMPEPWMAAGFT
jgi:hypothetical protein